MIRQDETRDGRDDRDIARMDSLADLLLHIGQHSGLSYGDAVEVYVHTAAAMIVSGPSEAFSIRLRNAAYWLKYFTAVLSDMVAEGAPALDDSAEEFIEMRNETLH